jgi:hypothetical protein
MQARLPVTTQNVTAATPNYERKCVRGFQAARQKATGNAPLRTAVCAVAGKMFALPVVIIAFVLRPSWLQRHQSGRGGSGRPRLPGAT